MPDTAGTLRTSDEPGADNVPPRATGRSAAEGPRSGLTRVNRPTPSPTSCGFHRPLFAIHARICAAANIDIFTPSIVVDAGFEVAAGRTTGRPGAPGGLSSSHVVPHRRSTREARRPCPGGSRMNPPADRRFLFGSPLFEGRQNTKNILLCARRTHWAGTKPGPPRTTDEQGPGKEAPRAPRRGAGRAGGGTRARARYAGAPAGRGGCAGA